jgi:DNA mismatch repair protein MutS
MKTKKHINTISQTFEVWKTIKAKYISAIVLVRRGEHYFTFCDDAIIVNQITSIEIISNKQKEQQCRFLFYQFDAILSTLVRAGHRVAACDQLE